MLFFIIYLPIFSFGIFAPTEIFFANYKDFGVIFDEFGQLFLKQGTLLALGLTFVTLFLPKIVQKIWLFLIWVISLGGYVQTMFLNKNLDEIGATTDGYIPETSVVVKNFAIWGVIIAIALFILMKSISWLFISHFYLSIWQFSYIFENSSVYSFVPSL